MTADDKIVERIGLRVGSTNAERLTFRVSDLKALLRVCAGMDEIEDAEMAECLEVVCAEFKICARDLRGPSRLARHAGPRQIYYYLAREHARASYPAIGRSMKDGRDHSTVYYGVRRIAGLVDDGDRETIRRLASLRERLKS